VKKEFIAQNSELPVCAPPDGTQTAIVGMLFSIDMVASAPDGMITGVVANLPLWVTFSIVSKLPAHDLITRISGTPKSRDKGLNTMSIVFKDNDGNQSESPFKVKVFDHGFTDEEPGVF